MPNPLSSGVGWGGDVYSEKKMSFWPTSHFNCMRLLILEATQVAQWLDGLTSPKSRFDFCRTT